MKIIIQKRKNKEETLVLKGPPLCPGYCPVTILGTPQGEHSRCAALASPPPRGRHCISFSYVYMYIQKTSQKQPRPIWNLMYFLKPSNTKVAGAEQACYPICPLHGCYHEGNEDKRCLVVYLRSQIGSLLPWALLWAELCFPKRHAQVLTLKVLQCN